LLIIIFFPRDILLSRYSCGLFEEGREVKKSGKNIFPAEALSKL